MPRFAYMVRQVRVGIVTWGPFDWNGIDLTKSEESEKINKQVDSLHSKKYPKE